MLSRCGEGAALAGDDRSVAAVLLCLDEGAFGFGQPPESQEGPGATERSVAESGSLAQDEVVLAQRRSRIVAHERDRRETHAILEGVRVGH